MDQPDRIHLRDHVIAAEIGAFQSERGRTQRLRFGIEAELADPVIGADDLVDRILSYDVLTDAVRDGLADRRYDLLETLAERIAAQILTHPRAARVVVTIEKLDRGPGALGVTIARRAGRVDAAAEIVRPTVLLADAVDAAPTGPVVIVPPAAGLPLPQGGNARRIALLALDQSAWALAGRLGLTVADSRTEIDWAAAQGIAIVWAPSRMVGDVPNVPAIASELAFWLADQFDATSLEVATGGDMPAVPANFRIPVRRR